MVRAIVLTCMDYRFVGSIAEKLNALGYECDYDLFVAAGGSLMYSDDRGINVELASSFGAWQKSFEDHVGLAVNLHNVSEIVVVDHEDCGAYNAYYGEKTDEELEDLNESNMKTFVRKLKAKYPSLKVVTMMARQ